MKSIALFCFISAFAAGAFACGGCSVKKFSVKACPGSESSNVIRFHLDSLTLTSECAVKARGWLNTTKTVKEMHSKWQFQKGVLKRSGDSDGCKALEKASQDKESAGFVKLIGLPSKCPLEKGNIRINKEADVSKYKDKMHLLNGPSSGKVDVSHGDAGRTCYTYEAVIECKSG